MLIIFTHFSLVQDALYIQIFVFKDTALDVVPTVRCVYNMFMIKSHDIERGEIYCRYHNTIG